MLSESRWVLTRNGHFLADSEVTGSAAGEGVGASREATVAGAAHRSLLRTGNVGRVLARLRFGDSSHAGQPGPRAALVVAEVRKGLACPSR